MSNQADHTIVRLRVPPELKQKIEESAEKNNRSQSAEMVHRLEESFRIGLIDSLENNLDINHSTPKSKLVESDPVERRRLAQLAMVSSAIENMPTQEFLNLLFMKMNSNGLALTVEEIKKSEEIKDQLKSTNDKKAP